MSWRERWTEVECSPMRTRNLGLVAAVAFLFGCGPEITVINPLAVVNWSPHDGAVGIELNAQPSVCLSIAIDEDSLDQVSLRVGDAEPGHVPETLVDAEIGLSEIDGACITFAGADFEHDTTYYMVLEPDLRSSDGATLGVRVSSKFRTVAEL